jgi:hypothetical protein
MAVNASSNLLTPGLKQTGSPDDESISSFAVRDPASFSPAATLSPVGIFVSSIELTSSSLLL